MGAAAAAVIPDTGAVEEAAAGDLDPIPLPPAPPAVVAEAAAAVAALVVASSAALKRPVIATRRWSAVGIRTA